MQPPESNDERARLLIVDDESAQMKALCRTLEHEGYHTTGFTSAVKALDELRGGARFELLLTDLKMPEMDGIELLGAARGLDGDLVGVVMTGHGTIDTAIAAMKAGALDYILKPFKLHTILPVIDRALSIRRLRIDNAELQRSVARHAEELEKANKELEAFSYSVSHDLRAPLRAITGFAAILVEDHAAELSEEARRHLDTVVSSARRMEQLIEDLLQFSRFSRHPLSKQTVSPARIVESVLAELTRQESGRNVQVEVQALPDCEGDPSLLRQVLTNLIANALKFTRKRDPARIEIGCREEPDELVYFVRDNGAGFDMKYADKLFGVFQRMHRADEFEGTGIGLSIVQRIISRHGGRVWAEAEVDKGATFYFSLPKS